MNVQFFLISLCFMAGYASDCDYIFESKAYGGNKRGMFHSPGYPQKYPQNIRCKYQFIARQNEKVSIKFEKFNVEGLLEGCNKDFLDIYIEVKSLSENPIDSEILGRFCGHGAEYVPKTIVSLYNIIILDFYSDKNTQQSYNQDDHMGSLGFNGTFKFIPNAPYFPGTKKPNSNSNSFQSCNFVINSETQPEGFITSPTYPGIYPSNLNCSYLLQGQANQRIRLLFRDLDINHKNHVCTDDYLIVYDGKTEDSPIIGERLCGERPNLKLISTENVLLIKFITGDFVRRYLFVNGDGIKSISTNLLQKKGFHVVYNFSSEFIKITKPLSLHHIRGTECDMWIRSLGNSSGILTSPGYPEFRMPSNKICIYFLYGIHNQQKMETAILKFDSLNIPSSPDNKCSAGSLSIYSLKVTIFKIKMNPKPTPLPDKPDQVICGNDHQVVQEIHCKGPLVLLKFNTTNAFSTGIGGFKLRYWFKQDFGIQGTMAKDGVCHFIYHISNASSGIINSPFYSNLYPANTTCQYDIVGNKSHKIRVYFEEFSLAEAGVKRQTYHFIRNSTCDGDVLKMFQNVPNYARGREESIETSSFCGNSIAGPIVNDDRSRSLTFVFKSDSEKSHSGFLAHFDFIPKDEITKTSCGGNVSSQTGGGIITSYRYPRRYRPNMFCQWSVQTNTKLSRIMIHFHDFVVEGSRQNCAKAILRIYEAGEFRASSEICGTDSAIPSFISETNKVNLRFITTPKSQGQKGFKLIWSEILRRSPDGTCPGFECEKSKQCIRTELECDGIAHCGTYESQTQGKASKLVVDNSDEEKNCPVTSSYNLLHIGLGIIITMLVLILLVVYVLYKEHRKQQNKSISTFIGDIPDGKLLSNNNVLLMGQINPPMPPIYPQQFSNPHSDVMSLPAHYNSASSSSRPPSNLSQTLSNHHNRYTSKDSMNKASLRRAHSTKHIRYPNHEVNFQPLCDSYRTMSYLAKSQNCNLNRENNFDFFNYNDPNLYSTSGTSDGGTWTRERMQKISMV